MKEYRIAENDANQRVDRFLKKVLPSASLGSIYKMIRTGKVKILFDEKKSKLKVDSLLHEGSIVLLYLSPDELQKYSQKSTPNQEVTLMQWLKKNNIIFEDEDIMLYNKDAGMNVHPGDHKSQELSLIQLAHDYFWKTLQSHSFRPSLVHRLDRDTTGAILIAKKKPALMRLSEDFKSKRCMRKIYYCICIWKLSRPSATIKKALLRIENAKNENKVRVDEKWQEAISRYKCLAEYKITLPNGSLQTLSEVEVEIETGRMHQIRVHMAHLWCPVLWDMSYGEKRLNNYFASTYGVKRQMLHAWKLEFEHPTSKKILCFEAKFKRDMRDFVASLKK